MTKQGGWESTGFGARLKALRETSGLTQKQLADKASCNQFTIAKLERGTQEPAWPLVLSLAAALGVTCEAFTRPTLPLSEQSAAPPRPGRPAKPTMEPASKAVKPRGRPKKAKE